MLNNDVRLIGVALTNYEINGKIATFKIEITKQKSGEPYTVEITTFTNSKSIKFDEKIKGRLVAVAGYLAINDGAIQVCAANVMALTGHASSPASVNEVPVITSQDLESKEIVVNDDDLPF